MRLSVCVYGSSSRNTPEAYKAAARTLGAALAERDHLCINGAGAEGVMGALNEACKAAGGRVRGVCHKMFVDGPITALFDGLELIQTEGDGLTERKRGLAEGADCFIALPGGPGTWDELWEVACARQLGVGRTGPVCLVNTNGYYDGFVTQLARAHADQLLHRPPEDFLFICAEPLEALLYCEAHAGEQITAASGEHPVGERTEPASAQASAAPTAAGAAAAPVPDPMMEFMTPPDPVVSCEGYDGQEHATAPARLMR